MANTFDHVEPAYMKQAFDEAWKPVKFVGATVSKAELLQSQIPAIILELTTARERNTRVPTV